MTNPLSSHRNTLTVIYRTGGTESCTWRRCLPVASLDKANKQKADIERMGYKAIVHKTRELEAIGMPSGWTA